MEIDALVPVSRVGADERTPVPPNPAEVLALLMDFSGSVTLAELLQAPLPEGPPHPDASELAWKLQERVRKQLNALSTMVLRPLTGRHAPPHPTPQELMAALERCAGAPGQVPDARDPQGQHALERFARDLGTPYFKALYKAVQQAQLQTQHVRLNITMELRQLGPRAARLEHIDSALQRSVQGKQIELFERLVLAAELTFERACARACAELPAGFGVDELARWSAEDGWLDRYRERCVRMTQAMFGHLQRGLEGLVVAAVHAEIS
jgi:hypothetical protein